MGRLLETLLQALADAWAGPLARLAARTAALLALAAETLWLALRQAPEHLDGVVEKLLFAMAGRSPAAQEAALQAFRACQEALRPFHAAALALGLAAVALVALATLPPLVLAALRCPRARVFVSFQHDREAEAQALQHALAAAGLAVIRLPFAHGAGHQQIVGGVTQGLQQAHLLVCVPGVRGSFADSEVLAATVARKLVSFVVSEISGRLPDTADKRYPVFRLERLAALGYRPLAQFLAHAAGDLRSTVQLVAQTLRHPRLAASLRRVLAWGAACAAAVTLLGAARTAAALAAQGPALAGFEHEARLSMALSLALLALLALAAAAAALYAGLAAWGLHGRLRLRRRLRLAGVQGEFRRDEWRGAMPGLEPGGAAYEALFDSAPIAHHERAA